MAGVDQVELAISLAGVNPKPTTTELLATADLVITMSRHAAGATLPPGAARQQHWQLDSPGDDLEAMRSFCDQVDQQVQALLASCSRRRPDTGNEPRRPGPAGRPGSAGLRAGPAQPTPSPRSQVAA